MSTTDLQGLTEKEKEKRSHAVIIPQDFCTVLLDIAFQRLLIKDGGDGLAENETWAQEFSSASDFSQFRSRLVQPLTMKFICLMLFISSAIFEVLAFPMLSVFCQLSFCQVFRIEL